MSQPCRVNNLDVASTPFVRGRGVPSCPAAEHEPCVLVTAAGWRSIFLVNVPICLLTIVLLRRFATESPKNPDRRADVPGLLLGVSMLAELTASFITAGQQGWLTPLPAVLLGAGLVTGWLFLRAVLGSLLGQGHALSLRVPLLVATAGYLVAIALVCVTLRDR